jgi:hypothetical protein
VALESSAYFVHQLFAVMTSLLHLTNENGRLSELCPGSVEQAPALGVRTWGMTQQLIHHTLRCLDQVLKMTFSY